MVDIIPVGADRRDNGYPRSGKVERVIVDSKTGAVHRAYTVPEPLKILLYRCALVPAALEVIPVPPLNAKLSPATETPSVLRIKLPIDDTLQSYEDIRINRVVNSCAPEENIRNCGGASAAAVVPDHWLYAPYLS